MVASHADARNAPTMLTDPSGKNPCVALGAVLVGTGPVDVGAVAVCLGIFGLLMLAASNPPDVTFPDFAKPQFPEPFEAERHWEVEDTVYQSGLTGPEIKAQLGRWCEQRQLSCTGATLAALLASTGLLYCALQGEGAIDEAAYRGGCK